MSFHQGRESLPRRFRLVLLSVMQATGLPISDVLTEELHFRVSRGEGNQVLEERRQFAVLGAVRQSGEELFSQHFSGNRTPPVRM